MIELRTGELFAGAGGLSLGLALADHPVARFRLEFAIDNDHLSVQTYKIGRAHV